MDYGGSIPPWGAGVERKLAFKAVLYVVIPTAEKTENDRITI